MTNARFFSLLGLFTAAAALVALGCHLFFPLDYAVPLTVGVILLFICLCVGLFFLGQMTLKSENKYLFTNVFMGVTMLKLFICAGIIGAYIYLGNPENKLFVIPFFLCYLIYTGLEILFLIKLAGQTNTVTEEVEAEK